MLASTSEAPCMHFEKIMSPFGFKTFDSLITQTLIFFIVTLKTCFGIIIKEDYKGNNT